MTEELQKALAEASKRFPYQRVCQLIFNALDKQGAARDAMGRPLDLFYVRDSTLLNALNEYNEL